MKNTIGFLLLLIAPSVFAQTKPIEAKVYGKTNDTALVATLVKSQINQNPRYRLVEEEKAFESVELHVICLEVKSDTATLQGIVCSSVVSVSYPYSMEYIFGTSILSAATVDDAAKMIYADFVNQTNDDNMRTAEQYLAQDRAAFLSKHCDSGVK